MANVTDRVRAEGALSMVGRRAVEAQEQERARIARDLHDDVAQELAVVAIKLEQLQLAVPDWPARPHALLCQVRSELKEVSSKIHQISHGLHSFKLACLGTVEAMRRYCRDLGKTQGVEIDFQSYAVPNNLPSEVSLSLFRVLQEALHNAVKHSGVKRFDVQLCAREHTVHLTVQDFGVGFDIEAVRKNPGLGLTSMQERLRLVNGEVSIYTEPRHGTTVHAHVKFSSESLAQAA